MQPIKRFGFDAAIIFSDILIVPFALGQTLSFVEGEGPKLNPPLTAENFGMLRNRLNEAIVTPVYETVRLTRQALSAETTLLGFCGAPWTVATYMIAGEGLAVGRDTGDPVTKDYAGERPYRFTGGTIDRVAVDVSGEPYIDLEREAQAMLMRE